MKVPASVSRRHFLSASSASIIAGAAAPGLWNAASRAQVAGANERFRVALIGCGGQGLGNLQHFQEQSAEIVAVCDPDEGRMRQAREASGGKADMQRDFRNVLDRSDIDAVVVATPDHWHALPTVMACAAGKDVYVEKPLAYSVAEGRAIVAAADRTGRIVQIGTQQRGGAHYQEAVALIQEGALGTVSRARVWNVWNGTRAEAGGGRWGIIGNPPDGAAPAGVDYDLWLGPAPARAFNPNRFHWNYVYFWDYAGGMMTGWGVHHVDIVHWALGKDTPKTVASSGGTYVLDDARETPDTLDTLFEYEGFTLQASMYHGNARPIEGSDYGVAFYGTEGTMLLKREGYKIWREDPGFPEVVVQGTDMDGPFRADFIRCCKERRQPMADAATGQASTIPVLLANIAFRTGRKLRWDGAAERFQDDPEADAFLSREYRSPWSLEQF
jgi:predicted dehydrogenase